jgi:hypothetical protein
MNEQQQRAERDAFIADISGKLVRSGVPQADALQTATYAVEGSQAAIKALYDYFEPIDAGAAWTCAMGIALQLVTHALQDQSILLRQTARQFGIPERTIVVGGTR